MNKKVGDVAVSDLGGYVTLLEIQRGPNNFFDHGLIRTLADIADQLDSDDSCRVIVLATETTMPRWFNATTSILGGITIPAMLLMLGTSLARLNISSVRETLTVAVMRLAIGLVLGLAAIYLFDLTGMLAGVVLLQATMPAAVFNYVFAERYNREPDKVAAVILQSTVMSVLSLPLLVGWALTF